MDRHTTSTNEDTIMMRVTRIEGANETTLQVDGKLRSACVDELARECRSFPSRLALELKNLCSIDASGVNLLEALASQGVELRGASHYIAMQLKQDTSHSMS
jgi:ABC-type transporter Mla MlaB component